MLLKLRAYNYPDGFTVNIKGETIAPQNGYAVGIEEIHDSSQLVPYVLDELKGQSSIYFGGWFSQERDIYVIDAVRILYSKDEAIALAVRHKQEAIYDFETGESIYVK